MASPRGCLLAAALLLGRPSASGPVPVRIEFQAPAGCSSLVDFYSEVRSRTERIRLANEGEEAWRIRVRLVRASTAIHGELKIYGEQGETETRAVDGDTCDEVVEALSLTAALAVDPSARLAPAGSASAPVPSPVPATPSASAAPVAQPTAIPSAGSASGTRLPAPPEKVKSTITVGLGALAGEIVSPRASFGAAVFGRVKSAGRAGPWQGPVAGIALIYVPEDFLQLRGNVAVQWAAARVIACPFGWEISDKVRLDPCASGIGGWLRASARSITYSHPVSRSWWSVGALLNLTISAGRGWAVEPEIGVNVPLARRKFVTTYPREQVGETPWVSVLGGVGLSYGF